MEECRSGRNAGMRTRAATLRWNAQETGTHRRTVMNRKTKGIASAGAVTIIAAGVAGAMTSYRARLEPQAPPFHLMEATIDDVHRAIRSGQITCQGLLEAYLSRAKAYNGVSNALVTKD